MKTFTSLTDQLNRIVASNYNAKNKNQWAETISEYFDDYDHVAHIKTHFPEWIFQSEEIEQWCKEHCHGTYTYALHRVNKEDSNIIDPMSLDERLYFAFKDHKDYTMFVLRWL